MESQRETNPILYVLITLIFVGLIIATYLLGIKNPLNLSFGEKATPVVVATSTPTNEPVLPVETFSPTPTAVAPKAREVQVVFSTPSPTPAIFPIKF